MKELIIVSVLYFSMIGLELVRTRPTGGYRKEYGT